MLRKMSVWTLISIYVVSVVGCGQPGSSGYSELVDGSAGSDGAVSPREKPLDDAYVYQATGREERLTRDERSSSNDKGQGPGMVGDKYDLIVEPSFVPVREQPLSTFSIDVDTASYSKTRMYLLQQNSLPPADAVRIEEFVNYFDYDYSPPVGEHPFSVNVEVANTPWHQQHRLVRIGLKGRDVRQQRPASNLVFLLDVSGSMDYPNKLPLVKQGLRMLVSRLGENDRVAIVVYAGAAGLVLPTTHGDDRQRILSALEGLHAGGSTNGGRGIQLAYQVARQNFIRGGVNRVILCSDGDFNVGTTSPGELVRLAEREAKAGVYLSVLGFGTGNHNDAMLEQLSNKANGNYAFIDTAAEARKVLCDQINSTLVTIAKDVKIQVEFNPAHVAAYRLIGYENRRLAAHEFNDDRKDAGEIGAGHTVTALYEIVPVGEAGGSGVSTIDPLKYQKQQPAGNLSDELLTVKLRYKQPNASRSQLIVASVKNAPVPFEQATNDFQFASSVAAFGMLLRGSEYLQDANYASILKIANATRGQDRHGYRSEFVEMVTAAGRLAGEPLAAVAIPATIYPTTAPMIPAISYTPPTPVNYSTSYNWSTFVFWIIVAGVGFSILVTISVASAVVILCSRMLVLPNKPSFGHQVTPGRR